MIKLETQFTSGDGGFSTDPLNYNQVQRTDKVALYSRSRDGRTMDYEVFFIKVEPKGKVTKFPGGVVKVAPDDKELYPSTGQFGKIAWTCGDLARAKKKFNELVNQSNIPEDESESMTVEFTIPDGEFTTRELADKNNTMYPVAALFIKTQIETGKIKFVKEERRNAKGKPSKIYVKA